MSLPDQPVHVVFGATGGVDTAVVAELVRRVEKVRAVSRADQAPEGDSRRQVHVNSLRPTHTRRPDTPPASTNSSTGHRSGWRALSCNLGAPCLPLSQALPGLPDVLAVTLVARPVRAPPQGRSP